MPTETLEVHTQGRGQRALGVLISHGIVAAMMVSASLSFTAFLTRLVPGWQLAYVPWVTLLVALEAQYAWRVLNTNHRMTASAGLFRIGELVFLLAAARLGFYIEVGFGRLVEDLPGLRVDFFSSFFPGDFVVVVIFLALVWLFSSEFAADLAAMETEEFIVDFETLGVELLDRSRARRLLLNRIFQVGGAMVVLSALVRADLGFLWGDRGSIDYGGLNVLVYFLLALALVSQSQFSILRARWTYDRVPLGPGLTSAWIAYSLVLFALVTGIALVLPSGYSIGILQLISFVVGYLSYFIFAIFSVILLLLARVLSWVTFEPETLSQALPDFSPPSMPPPPVTPDGGVPWIEFIRSLLFWLAFGGVVVYALFHYLRQHETLLQHLGQIRGFGWLFRGVQALVLGLHRWKLGLDGSVRAGAEKWRAWRTRPQAEPAWLLVNPLRYSPKDRIIYFYLALIRKGGRHGHPRKTSNTPYEYAGRLKPHMGQAADDLDQLTESFLEARYSREVVGDEKAGRARRAWRRVFKALKGLGPGTD